MCDFVPFFCQKTLYFIEAWGTHTLRVCIWNLKNCPDMLVKVRIKKHVNTHHKIITNMDFGDFPDNVNSFHDWGLYETQKG